MQNAIFSLSVYLVAYSSSILVNGILINTSTSHTYIYIMRDAYYNYI